MDDENIDLGTAHDSDSLQDKNSEYDTAKTYHKTIKTFQNQESRREMLNSKGVFSEQTLLTEH